MNPLYSVRATFATARIFTPFSTSKSLVQKSVPILRPSIRTYNQDDTVDVKPSICPVVERTEFLTTLIGLPAHKLRPSVKSFEVLRTASESNIEAVVKLLKANGIEDEEILEEPRILAVFPLLLDNYIQCLKELGILRPPVKLIKNYPYYSRKRLSLLRAHGIIPSGDVIGLLLKNLGTEELKKVEDEVRASTPSNFLTEWTLQDLWARIEAAYLAEKWDIDLEAASKILSMHPRTKNKSLSHFRENVHLTCNLFRIPLAKVMSNAYLLSGHPDNMRKIWTEVPTLAGLPTRDVVAKFPKLLMCPADNLKAIDKHLRDVGLPVTTMQRALDVYTLSPSTVKRRLSEVDKVPEFQALKFHPRVLRLVLYQNKAKTRLQHLENLNLKCLVSLDMLSAPSKKFDKFIESGGGVKNRGRDLSMFLSTALRADEDFVKEELRKHVYWCHVPLVEVKGTLTLLLVKGFREEQILNALQLLLYPEDLVLQYIQKIPDFPELQPFETLWKDNPRYLHLVLYYIEREASFNGLRVFRDTTEKQMEGISPEHEAVLKKLELV